MHPKQIVVVKAMIMNDVKKNSIYCKQQHKEKADEEETKDCTSTGHTITK